MAKRGENDYNGGGGGGYIPPLPGSMKKKIGPAEPTKPTEPDYVATLKPDLLISPLEPSLPSVPVEGTKAYGGILYPSGILSATGTSLTSYLPLILILSGTLFIGLLISEPR